MKGSNRNGKKAEIDKINLKQTVQKLQRTFEEILEAKKEKCRLQSQLDQLKEYTYWGGNEREDKYDQQELEKEKFYLEGVLSER